jgi:hypothetical protein
MAALHDPRPPPQARGGALAALTSSPGTSEQQGGGRDTSTLYVDRRWIPRGFLAPPFCCRLCRAPLAMSVVGLCGVDFGAALALFEKEYASGLAKRQRDCLRQVVASNEPG